MKEHTTKLIAAVFALSLAFSISAAASGSSTASGKNADALYSLGLFRGTGAGYDLDGTPTRIQGLVMLIRMLGEENKALSFNSTDPFTDVPKWADCYVSYAAAKGYTKGTGTASFSPDTVLDARSYLTFVLRALGYDDAKSDFSWNTAPLDSVGLGLMKGDTATVISGASLNRGDIVDLSFCALTMSLKGETTTLAQKLVTLGVFSSVQGKTCGVLGEKVLYTYIPFDSSTVDYARKTVTLNLGKITADVITVNLNNPKVSVKSAMVNNTLGATAAFSDIVSQSGATAVINANFFEAYQPFEIPIGHVVVNGQFMYGVSGLTAFGFTSDNKVEVGKPSFFYRVAVSGSAEKNWPCYELNSTSQDNSNSIVYTPAFGTTLNITCNGTAVVIEGGAVSLITPCYSGDTLTIPSNGYIMWLGSEYTSTDYYHTPEPQDKVSLTPYLFKTDDEGFTFDNVTSVVSGAPRLVKDGQMETYLDPGFTEARFTTSSSPRTAIGTLYNGRIILVSVGAATIQQMRELMLSLGCEDAVNLDGGSSTSMYVNGNYIRSPGRKLTTTLQVFVTQ